MQMSNSSQTAESVQMSNSSQTPESVQMSNSSQTPKSTQMPNSSQSLKSPQTTKSIQTSNISQKSNSPVNSKFSLHQNGVDDKTDEGGVRWLSQQMSAPRPIVICGPSGSGKSTLLKYLMAEFGDCFGFSVSHTTRKPRPGETHGKEYNFVDHSEMEKAIANGEFLEFTEFSGNIYGTSKSAVHSIQDQGRICILDIEIDGVRNIKKTDLNPRYVFIKPPSLKVLEQRLRSRGTESEESIKKRLARAREELMYGETSGNFDTVIINDDAKEAYKQLKLFLLRDIEELKKRREEKKQIEEKKKIEEQKMLEQKKKNEH